MLCNAHGNTEMNKDKSDFQIKTYRLLNMAVGHKSSLLLHFFLPLKSSRLLLNPL